jgi:sugar lactone lactonase YvrE
MGSGRFDAWTRSLATIRTRRGTLGALGALLAFILAPFGLGLTAAKKKKARGCRRVGKKCGGKHNRKCCDHAKCRGGRCKCTGNRKACRGTCIPNANCCDDADCGGGATCQNGVCHCPSGKKDCDGACIPEDDCCTNADCGDCESCQAAICVTGCQSCETCQSGTCNSTCPGGQICQGNVCVCPSGQKLCVDTCILDEECCGPCGPCEICDNGTCIPGCQSGQECVSDSCVCTTTSCSTGCCAADATCKPGTNPNFCGTGGNECLVCDQHETCPAGACLCEAPFTVCGVDCVNLNNDDDHCGSCDNSCAGTATCQSGACKSGGDYAFATQWDGADSGLAFQHPLGVAVDSTGNVYVADDGSNRVLKFTSSGGFLTAWSSGGSGAVAVAVNWSSGDIYVANSFSGTIQPLSSDGTPGDPWSLLDAPNGVAVNQSKGEVYVTIAGSNGVGVQRFQSNGVLIENWLAPDSPFDFPYGIGIAPIGDVYISDDGTCEVLRFTADGDPLPVFTCNGSIEFDDPLGVAVDAASNVYVCDSGNKRVLKLTADGDLIGQIGDESNFEFPAGVAVSLSGYVYVADGGNAVVEQFIPS